MPNKIFKGCIPTILLKILIKLSDEIKSKNKGIQNKESEKDQELIFIFRILFSLITTNDTAVIGSDYFNRYTPEY
ncbi:hypothetical protein AU377_03015 [Sporosarcina sp. HYO08]|nr:hypothetical protein AU377_03015 [Sporosarcina sp. HYO08]